MGGELIEAEHQARYRLALPHVGGKRVLDAGCGVGWGAELLLAAGAQSVVGVDLSPEAVADCRKRVPGAEFIVGDLQCLPVADADFDAVVCFEALEHTADTDATLNELRRALRPGGLLFVSSPNPRVYPAGNPFHLHEMTPEELLEAVSARFTHVEMYRQHLFLSALLAPESAHGSNELQTEGRFIRPLEPGHDAYSVAVASQAPLPPIESVQCLAPSDQLDNLGALAAALTEERETLHEDHRRITDERGQLLDAVTDAEARLKVAGEQLQSVMDERDNAVAQLRQALSAVDELKSAAQLTDGRLRRIAAERDQFARTLVNVEQDLARRREPTDAVEQQLRERLDDAAARALHLDHELDSIRNTVSWRLTAPLRAVRSRQRSRSTR